MARSQVSLLVQRCLHQRVPPQEFGELIKLATEKWKSSSTDVVASLTLSALKFCLENDPLVSAYLQIVLASQQASLSDCIAASIMCWQHGMKMGGSDITHQATVLAQIMTDLAVIISSLSMTTSEARKCMVLSSRWLRTLFKLSTGPDGKHSDEQISMLTGSICVFLITSMNTTAGAAALKLAEGNRDDPINTTIRQALDGSMSTFPDMSMQLLAEAQKYPALLEVSNTVSEHAQDSHMVEQFETNIANPQIMPTRLATYMFLQNKILNASTIDDTALCNFLRYRYPGNDSMAFNDLLASSFDAYTKPVQASEPLYLIQCRIFLHNKLPTVLELITRFGQVPTEQCLEELWNDVNTLQDTEAVSVAKHFLHVCILHRFISAEAVQRLTGQDQDSTSAKALFPAQALVDQVVGNASRGPRLVDELLKNDGNAGSISQAIVEVVHRYCQAKETQRLKDIANAIVRQPATINAIGMFVKPSYFLSPLCNLIDDWTWDIHGESQPIYEEFGSILLLIMTIKYRLGLANSEIGIAMYNGFMAQFLSSGHCEKSLSQMTEPERNNLGAWLHNLYESEGIDDDVTTNCSAKEFYLMVPTLLRQSMVAMSKGKLSQDKLEGGLDYLLEPFLLPSLLSAFAWLVKAAQHDSPNTAIVIQRLAKVPDNPDTNRLHHTILAIAQDMFRTAMSKSVDQNQATAGLLGLLGETTPFVADTDAQLDELDGWIHNGEEVLSHLQKSIVDLLAIPSSGLFRPNLMYAAMRVKGSAAVIHTMVLLLVEHATSQNFAQLLDILATVIVSTKCSGVSLRNSLQMLHAQLRSFLKKEVNLFAEALVHLHRRVEYYAEALTVQPTHDDPALMSAEGVDLAGINLDQIPLEAEVTKHQTIQIQPTDPLAGEDMEQMLNEAANMGNIEDYTGNEEDMFNMDNYEDNYENLTSLEDLDMSMF